MTVASDAPELRQISPPSSPKPYASGDALERQWADPPGVLGWLSAVQNDTVGQRILATSFLFFVLGGLNALLLRMQLARAENTLLSPETYNQLFTMHGSTMMFLFAVPMLEGFAVLLLPFMLGSREMPFPRLGVYAFFTFLFGGLLFYTSFLFGTVPDVGWTAYVPLSGLKFSPGIAVDYWLLALSVAEIGAIAAGVEIIISILKMRAPGMAISRMPLFAWAMLVMAFSLIFAFVPLIVGSALLEVDRKLGTRLFDPAGGGSPLLWQHLFWIFGHPEVYLQFIPASGLVSMIIPILARRRMAGYTFVAMAIVATGFISFGLWVHHMFTAGLPQVAMTFFAVASMVIAIPSGVQVFAWLTTIATGRPVWKTPFLFVIGFLVLFVLGGITGVMVAMVPFDWQVHDSYFVVAHFHYVLIGGAAFPIFAAMYFWLPKFTGRLLDERLGKWNFWLMFIGFNITFFPMHISGLLGMPRRVYTYPAGLGWDIYNLISTIGAFILAAGVLVFIANVVYSLRRGEPAGRNPWGADSLEWSTQSPPVNYGFRLIPIVRSRHPLWDQASLEQGDDRLVRMLRALARWPVNWRAALITSTLDARPEEVFRVPGPSLWPFLTAASTVLMFLAEIFELRWLLVVGLIATTLSIIGWNWPDRIDVEPDEVAAFEKEHNIPVHVLGSPTITRWSISLVLMIIGIALASLLFAYFYIRLEHDAWPPPGVALPGLLWPAVSAAIVVGAGAALAWARRVISAGRTGLLKLGLALAFGLGLAALALQAYDLGRLDFTHQTHAYGSLFFVLAGFAFLIAISGLIMNAVVQLWAWRGKYSARHRLAVDMTSLYWNGITVAWLVAFGVVYLAPYVI